MPNPIKRITRGLRDLKIGRKSYEAGLLAKVAKVDAAKAAVVDRYLDLMRDVMIGRLSRDPAQPYLTRPQIEASGPDFVVQPVAYDEATRDNGLDWPLTAFSMIGTKRMDNLRRLCKAAIADGVAGDFVETGVWRGGACIFMRAILEVHGCTDRKVWVCDSFEGLPPPDAGEFPADEGLNLNEYDGLSISLEAVQDNFRSFGFLDGQVEFVKGWFKDTLHLAPIERIAVLRLDGDLYQSTIEALEALYPKVSPGGYVIVDDYGAFEACRKAVHDYLGSIGAGDITLEDIDGIGAWFKKPA